MKLYPRILTVLLCVLMLLCTLTCCTPTPPDVPDTPDVPVTPDAPVTPDEPDTPDEPLVPLPQNSFSPTSDKAGTPFLDENTVQNVQTGNGITRFMLMQEHNPNLPFNVACKVARTEITAMLPAGIDLSAVTVSFAATSQIYLGDRRVFDGDVLDLREPLELTVSNSAGKTSTVTLDVQTLRTGLPSVALTVDEFAEINSKVDYFKSSFYLGGGDGAICDYATELTVNVGAQAKGRGNSSWGYPKRSFTVKLDEKKNLLGLGRSRNWTLVSNYQDKSLMRNEIAAQLSEAFGQDVTMNTRSVDLWLNGKYWGNYLLIEKIELESERIDLPDYDEVVDPFEAGVLLEWDGHVNEVGDGQKAQWQQKTENVIYDPVADIHFMRVDGGWLVIHKPSPSVILDEQLERIEMIVLGVDAAMRSRDYARLSECIDMDSFASWMLTEEMMKNMDSRFHSSCYMYFGRDGILHMGPVWDFDMSLGNANYGGIEDPTGQYIPSARWYKQLVRIPEFCALLAEKMGNAGSVLNAMPQYIDSYAAMLDRSQKYNFERWDILNTKVGWNPQSVVDANTYEKQIELLKNYYTTRLDVVREYIIGLTEEKPEPGTEPGTEPGVKMPEGVPKPPSKGVTLWSGSWHARDVRSLKHIVLFSPAVDLSAYAEDGVVCMTYWISSLDTLTSGHQFELTSSGGPDKGEFTWGLNPAKQMKAGSWQTLYLPISQAVPQAGGVTPDLSKINFFRIYIHVGETEDFYVSDLRVMHLDEIE